MNDSTSFCVKLTAILTLFVKLSLTLRRIYYIM